VTLLDRKRGLFDIVANLLEVLESGGCSKTTLASKANLATRSSTRYIAMILGFEMVIREESTNLFKITDKGRRFLDEYRKLRMFIQE
jgi:predicted transcriptional regulator